MNKINARQNVERIVLSAVKKVNEARFTSCEQPSVEINPEINPVEDLGFNVHDLNALKFELSAAGICLPSYAGECLNSRLHDLVDYVMENSMIQQ